MSVNIGSTAQEILNEINNKINKTTYEASAELACSSNGKVCLGKFGAYDTNITIELNSTTSKTYHATIVIWSQNVEPNATKGSVGCNVYGDADNNITPLISVFRPYGSASRQIEVYADLPGWSKNLVHIQGVAISDGGMTDVLTSVSAIPTAIDGKIKVTPINVLKSMFASKDVATTSAAGLMSAADKIKLDNVLTLDSIREDSSGNVVVAKDLIVNGVGHFGNDIEVAGTVKTNAIETTDYITLKGGYPIRFYSEDNTKFVDIQCNDEGELTSNGDLSTKNLYPTATNASNLGSSSKQYNTIYGKTIYENGTALSEKYAPKSTVGADQIKGIYLTGENRTIVGAESDVGIIWEGDGTLFKDENAITEITNTHFMTRVPIVAGNNVTFETDTENQVVKINATGGGGGTSGGTPTKIENGDGYVKVNEGGSIYLSTPSTGSDEMIGMEAEVVEINAPKSNSYIDIYAQNGSMTLNASNIDIMGGDVYIGKYISEGGDYVDNFYVRSNGAVALEGGGDVLIEQGGSGSKLFMDSYGDVTLEADYHLTLRQGHDESGIDIVMDADGTAIRHPNGINFRAGYSNLDVFPEYVGINADNIYVGGSASEGEDAVTIEAVNDGRVYITGGDVELYSANLKLGIGGSYGTAGQVLMSDGQYAYWGDVEGSSGGGSPMTPITYAELKALRDSGKLVAGMFYRITDYVCTTVQAETRAMNNRFDIIVQALSNNTLSETAKADYNAEDNYFKIESGGNALVEGSVQNCYAIIEDEEQGNATNEGYKSDDVFVAYDYLENNEGITVPVLYKNDLANYPDEGADYQDIFYYVGTYELDGNTYDMWRKIDPDTPWDATTKRYYLTNVIVENNEIVSSVKASGIKYNANLPAWELKYSLDNDTTRFAWADDSIGNTWVFNDELTSMPKELFDKIIEFNFSYYNPSTDTVINANEFFVYDDGSGFCWYYNQVNGVDDVYVYGDGWSYEEFKTITIIEEPTDETFIAWLKANATKQGAAGGKGVIYYMKDEHGNECPYDFKNIQFKRSTEWQEEHSSFVENSLFLSVGDVEWFYTFSWVNEDLSLDDLTMRQDLPSDDMLPYYTTNNKISPLINGGYIEGLELPNNLMISTYQYEDGIHYGCNFNTIGGCCYQNTFFAQGLNRNTIDKSVHDVIIASSDICNIHIHSNVGQVTLDNISSNYIIKSKLSTEIEV